MKIGLITIYHVPNYGSVLQTYATQEVLKSFGHDVRVIRYNYFNKRLYAEQRRRPSWREKLYPLKAILMPHSKTAILERFRKSKLAFTRAYNSIDSMYSYNWDDFDAFVVGSDQVWNTKYLCGDPCYLLSFVPDYKKRFSLSSSFSTKQVDTKYETLFKSELNKFSAISVRERNAVFIINEQLGVNKPVKVTLDPTLLLSKKQWLTMLPNNNKGKRKPYILYYMWTYAFEPRPYIYDVVRHFKSKMNCDVIALEGIRDSTDCKDVKFINADNSTIPEFLDLFANAELVITSSFHGTAFALNFGIPLISIVPDDEGDDRQTTLLKECGATNSIVRVNTNLELIQPEYDKQFVKERIEALRLNTLNWIQDNIK